jgi:hypothetical protein
MSAKKQGPKAGPSEADKARFREALDKKRSHAGRDISEQGEHGKIDHAHGAETTAREQMFRRKSG